MSPTMTPEEAVRWLNAERNANLHGKTVLDHQWCEALRLASSALQKEARPLGPATECEHPPRQDGSGSSREPVAWRITAGDGYKWYTDEKDCAVGAAKYPGNQIRPLYTSPPSRDIPEGWVMVPKTPTEEMVFAAVDELVPWGQAIAAYRAMISTTPPAPESK